MSPFIPVEDPSERGSLVDRTVTYVRSSQLLRIVLTVTLVNHAAAVALVLTSRMVIEFAGLLVLLSILTWFFAVALPVMNREVRTYMGAEATGYWGEVVEMFARVVLGAQTAAYTALLAYVPFS